MANIRRLSDSSARTISSHQIFPNIASIVKELLENALDAHAKSISIVLEDYGLGQITIQDDGVGIAREDCELLAKPHYTSKMAGFQDLERISSYGFRGEALAGLAHICQAFELTTRTSTDTVASFWHYSSKDQQLCLVKVAAQPRGTKITIRAPFYEAIVRRQQMRQQKAQLFPKLQDLLTGYSLVNLDVRIHLTLRTADKPPVARTKAWTPQKDLQAALMNTYGSAICSNYFEFRQTVDEFKLHAFLPKADNALGLSSARHYLFVNDRPIAINRSIGKMIMTMICKHVHTICQHNLREFLIFLQIECAATSYDPNVEPAKDVIFFDGHKQHELLEAIQDMLDAGYSPGESIVSGCGNKRPDTADCSERVGYTRSSSVMSLQDVPSDVREIEEQARKPLFTTINRVECASNAPSNDMSCADDLSEWKTSMFDAWEDDSEELGPQHTSSDSLAQTSSSNEVEADYAPDGSYMTTPWTIARLRSVQRAKFANTHPVTAGTDRRIQAAAGKQGLPALDKIVSATSAVAAADSAMPALVARRISPTPRCDLRQFRLDQARNVTSPTMNEGCVNPRKRIHSNAPQPPHKRRARVGVYGTRKDLILGRGPAVDALYLSGPATSAPTSKNDVEAASRADQVHDLSLQLHSTQPMPVLRMLQLHRYDHFVSLEPRDSTLVSLEHCQSLLATLSNGLSLWTAQLPNETDTAVFISKHDQSATQRLQTNCDRLAVRIW